MVWSRRPHPPARNSDGLPACSPAIERHGAGPFPTESRVARPPVPDPSRFPGESFTMRIYVGNLNYSVTSEELRGLFEPYGTVDAAEVQVKTRTGQSRGFGLVDMGNDGEAEAAVTALNGKDHQGRPLVVNESRPRRTVRDLYAGGGWYGSGR